MDENLIKNTPEYVYRKRVKGLVRKAAFQELLEKKHKLSKSGT